MSLYTIEVDDAELTRQIENIIKTVFSNEMHRKYSDTNEVISQAVKDMIYSHKDEIIEKVVERATKEIVRKGLPKLLEKVGEQG